MNRSFLLQASPFERQTFAEIRQVLVDALADYDTNVAPAGVADFSPIAPLAGCP